MNNDLGELEKHIKEVAGNTAHHRKILVQHVESQFREELSSINPPLEGGRPFTFQFNDAPHKDHIDGLKSGSYDAILKQYNQKALKSCSASLGYSWG